MRDHTLASYVRVRNSYMFASARGAKYCVCAAVTASTFGSSVTILKVTDVTDVTDVIAGSSGGGGPSMAGR